MKFDLIRLGEQLAEENSAAHDLWSWLPSHTVAEKHHGDYASAHCPSNANVMKEAAMYLDHLKQPNAALTPEEQEWFTRCPCGEDHAAGEGTLIANKHGAPQLLPSKPPKKPCF